MNSAAACGGVVLAGGASQRMGRPKAWLPVGDQTLLGHVVGILRPVVTPIVVVRAAVDEPLPELPTDVQAVCDRRTGLGPLEGLAMGLAALAVHVPRAVVTGCDGAWLRAGVVRRLIELASGYEAAVPWHAGHWHVLLGVYDTCLYQAAQQLIEQGAGPVHLLDRVRVRRIEAHELTDVDPQLACLRHVNTPEEYEVFLAAWRAHHNADG